MLFELKKEEASSLICIPHRTYSCLITRQSSYFIQLLDVPLEGVARFTFLCKFDDDYSGQRAVNQHLTKVNGQSKAGQVTVQMPPLPG